MVTNPPTQVNKRKCCVSDILLGNRQRPVIVSILCCTTAVTKETPKKKLAKVSENTNLTQTEVASMFWEVNSPEYRI